MQPPRPPVWTNPHPTPVSGMPVYGMPVSGTPVSALPMSGGPSSSPAMVAAPMPGAPMPLPPPALIAPFAFGPPRPTLFQRHWPARCAVAGADALVAALVAGVVAAIAIPVDRPGIGWLLASVAAAAGLLVVAVNVRRSAPEPTDWDAPPEWRRVDVAGLVWGFAVLALLTVGTVRAAGWLFVLCVLTAIGCAALSVAGGKTPIGLLMALLALPAGAFKGMPWAGRKARTIRQKSGGTAALRLAGSIAIGLALLLVFGALFASADPAFNKIVTTVLPDLNGQTLFRWGFLFSFVGAGTLGAAYLLTNPTTLGEIASPAPKPVRRLEWALPVGALVLLFAAFVGVQITVLFGDRDYVMRTVGLTFADYARRGFSQLLVITLLTLLVMIVAARKAPRVDAGDRLLLRLLLGGLAFGALVVVASALWRMSVYEQAYGFTRLRVFVSAFELWLGVLFVFVLVAGIRLRAAWLPRMAFAAWVLMLLGLAVLNPDRFIAEQNVARFERTQRIDVWYLSTLSADAAPVLNRLPEQYRVCALGKINRSVREDPDDWRAFNLARMEARRIAATGGATDPYCLRSY